ncbi:DUF397 domain-containing protein [Yinghuangia sp. YIM S09857]|uniref:DUF397 domain-containing protein n=1 Tax=Yinghuangia sp. YIM S09857 TaxID=3436929 RepID=UPI003F538E9D
MPKPPATVPRASALGAVHWFKSSASAERNGCVMIADLDGRTAVRDSKSADGPAFMVSASAWRTFIARTR